MSRVHNWRLDKLFSAGGVSALIAAALVLGAAQPSEARSRRGEQARDEAREEKGLPKATLPMLIVVSIPKQKVTVYSGNEKIAESPVSTGQPGHDTPTGVFTLLEKNRVHFSNLYGAAPMPFMERITWSGVALHAGALPGYPASHGCIRLPYKFARDLFAITALGARVIIVKDDATPADIAHGKLVAPLPVSAAEGLSPAPDGARAIEVASNDEADGARDSVLTGVSQAAAAAAASGSEWPRPRTQEEAAAIRAAKLARHESAISAAEAAGAEAALRLQAAVAAVRAADSAVEPARDEFEKLARLARKAEGNKADLEEELADLVRRAEKRPTPRNTGALAEKRPVLEEKIKVLTAEGAPARARADEAKAGLDTRLAAEKSAEEERAAAALAVKTAGQNLKTAQQAFLAAKRAEARRDLPISIFVSRKAGKLFVRQGYEAIAEAPVAIVGADQRIGTHVFTALEPAGGGQGLRWNAVSIPTRVAAREDKEKTGGKKDKDGTAAAPEPSPAYAQTASAALDRVTFPAETQDLLAELIKPGSTLMISDYDISNETGKYTDFIVLTRHPDDRPQVKSRRPRTSSGFAQRKPRTYYSPGPSFFW